MVSIIEKAVDTQAVRVFGERAILVPVHYLRVFVVSQPVLDSSYELLIPGLVGDMMAKSSPAAPLMGAFLESREASVPFAYLSSSTIAVLLTAITEFPLEEMPWPDGHSHRPPPKCPVVLLLMKDCAI